ncbi:MAG TPA: DUF4173 domain-containing protein [Gemmatimonadales bacterium]|nr:DUF4173 domain-containing protein [Gemmatimonadales bacterium]
MRHLSPDAVMPSETAHASSRALTARRALLAAAGLGVLADLLLRDGPAGIGLPIWMLAFGAALVALVRREGRSLSTEGRSWLAVAMLFAAGQAWRDSEMLHGFNFLAMLAALVLLAMSLNAIPVPWLAVARLRDLCRSALGTGLGAAFGMPQLLINDTEFHTVAAPATGARRLSRAVVITLPVLLIFTVLLADADPIFGSLFTLPNLDFELIFSHIVVTGFFAWVVGGWLRRSLLSRPAEPDAATNPFALTLGTTDLTLALGALNLLFATFVAVQIGWLFGGEALVLRTTGLSYAEYARRGFFELACVACLLLPVLLGAHALIPESDGRAHRRFRRLALPLTLLLGAIMVSAFARMRLYVHYYGISTDRLYATAFMVWLVIVFGWLALTVLRARPRRFALGMVASGFAVLAVLNIMNPDALVAGANLARAETGRTGAGGADLRYVASLGGDAVPLLVSALTAPQSGSTGTSALDRCTAADRLLKRWTAGVHWRQWNLAGSRAAEAVQMHAMDLQHMACASAPKGDG